MTRHEKRIRADDARIRYCVTDRGMFCLMRTSSFSFSSLTVIWLREPRVLVPWSRYFVFQTSEHADLELIELSELMHFR